MSGKLNLFICEHFKNETLAVLAAGDFLDVVPHFLPEKCARPGVKENWISSFKELSSGRERDNVLFGCSCVSKDDKSFLKEKNVRYLSLDNCFSMFLSKEAVNRMILAGDYIVTPGWLKNWSKAVEQWGGVAQSRQMFSETLKRIVLIDTGIDDSAEENLKEFSEALGLPAESLPSGLDLFRLYISNIVLQWKLEDQIRHSSDYAMAMDLLSNLPRAENEAAVIDRIIDLFNMFFAPGIIHYLPVEDGVPGLLRSIPDNEEVILVNSRLLKSPSLIRTLESGKGFIFKIGNGSRFVAIIEVDNIANPEYISHYQNLCISISGVFFLAIENARYYQRLLNINSKLSEAIKTKDKFFSIIAHDLKNPFFNILGFSELLMLNIGNYSQEKTREYLKIINDSSNQTYELLENLLLWSRSQTGTIVFNPEKLILNELIEDSVSLIKAQTEVKGIVVSSKLKSNIEIYADRNMISTVLRNLLTNAIKFTRRNGKISINAEIVKNFIEVSISDNGIGIPAPDIEKIFRFDEKISTPGTEKEKGTGLGLVLCKEFTEKHGGKVWAESEVGNGSRFIFTLPKI